MKKIAAITMAYNDEFFLNRWIKYYGEQFGEENLYILQDGLDQKTPAMAGNTNIEKIPKKLGLSRTGGDKYRINLISKKAAQLFKSGYDIVIGCDVDEFLIVDPKTNKNLAQYLSNKKIKTTVSGLGLDVGMDLNTEFTLDETKPFLEQRKFAYLSTRYTKPVVLSKPKRWGSGFHCVKFNNYHIDKNLYLLHFGSIDFEMIKNKLDNRNPDWKKHLNRRANTILKITKSKRRKFSKSTARFLQTILRPLYAWNKPAMLFMVKITTIPERFKKTGV